METIKATTTASIDVTKEFVKLIDGVDYNWDNDRKEMVIEKKGFIGEHSDILLSDEGDSVAIKRVWIRNREIDASTMWCRKTKIALSTMLDNEIEFYREEANEEIRNVITKTYDDGMLQVNINEFHNGEEVVPTIDRISVVITEKVDKEKIEHNSFLEMEMDEAIKAAYLKLDTEEKRKEFRTNYSKMKITEGVVSTVNMEENKIIKASDIDTETALSIMKSSMEDHSLNTTNTQENFKKLREKLKKQVTNDFIVKRGRVINGELDRLLTMKEVNEIDEEVSRLIESDKRLQVSADMSKINGVYDTLNNKNLDSQIAYELRKEIFCNIHGYTPESFDAYMNEIFRLQDEKLSSGGYASPVSSSSGDGFEETTSIRNMLNNDDVESKARVKLVKVDGWDDIDFKNKPILYRSELLLKVIEQDEKEMNPEVLERLRREDPNAMRLYEIMNDTIFSIERWRKVRQKRKGEQTTVVHKRSIANKTDVEKFMEARKESREKRKESGELTNPISAEIKISQDLIKKAEENIKTIDDVYDDIIDDDIETVMEVEYGQSKHQLTLGEVYTPDVERELRSDGSRIDEQVDRVGESEDNSSGSDDIGHAQDNIVGGYVGSSETDSETRHNDDISEDQNVDGASGSREGQFSDLFLDDIETIEVIEDDRPDTTRNISEAGGDDKSPERESEVQGVIQENRFEVEEQIHQDVPESNGASQESIETFGRRVYTENTTNISNIKITEVNENDDRKDYEYNDISSNDSTNYNDINTDTSSNSSRSERRTNDIQSEEVFEESINEQSSDRHSTQQLPSGNREISEMAERTEVNMLSITGDGNIILDNGKVVTPEEFKAMREGNSLTVEDMLADDAEEEVAEVQTTRVRITDDNLTGMFALILGKKATWQQENDYAVVKMTEDSTEYIYEPVSNFINKYTEFVMNNAISQTSPATKIKDVEDIKANIDELKEKPSRNKGLKDRIEEIRKAKEEMKEQQETHVDQVKIVEVTEVTDDIIEEINPEDDKFQEYDRPLETNVTKVPDTYFINRHRELAGKIDELSGVHQSNGDLAILRNSHNFSGVKDYWNSAVYSRDIYLPNSNYVVTVKRLRRRDVLSWMFTFLEGVKDANMAEDIARPDIISTVYEQLEFPFAVRPTEEEFLKNLHQTDVTILMSMFALVNLAEDKDDRVIIPNITKFRCTKCGKPSFLKNPMSIDIKDEFYAIYPKNLWLENYSNYKNKKYETIQKAYRDSKVGARYRVVNDNEADPFKIEIIISRPTVYKQWSVENSRLDVCYDIRLKELTKLLEKASNIGGIPDEVLKSISYMSDRTFREVRNRILILDGVGDLTRDINDVPEYQREQYKEFQEEARIIQFISGEIEKKNETLAATFNSCQYIDSMILVDKESGKPLQIVDHSNLYDIVDAVQYLSDATVNTINKKIEELRNGYNGISTNITFSPEEFKGKFRWDDVYQVVNGKIMSEKELLQHVQNEGGYSDNDMKEVAEIRQKYKANLEEGKCVCGNDTPWVLNWTDLLFFSTAKILGKTTNTESAKPSLL